MIFKCPECGKRLRVRDELVGKKGKCPGCGHVVVVPLTGAVEDLNEVKEERIVAKSEAPSSPRLLDPNFLRELDETEHTSYVDTARGRAERLLSEWRRSGRIDGLVQKLNHSNIIQALSGAIALGETHDSRAGVELRCTLGMGDKLVERFSDDPTTRAISQAFANLGSAASLTNAAHAGTAQKHAAWLREQIEVALQELAKAAP